MEAADGRPVTRSRRSILVETVEKENASAPSTPVKKRSTKSSIEETEKKATEEMMNVDIPMKSSSEEIIPASPAKLTRNRRSISISSNPPDSPSRSLRKRVISPDTTKVTPLKKKNSSTSETSSNSIVEKPNTNVDPPESTKKNLKKTGYSLYNIVDSPKPRKTRSSLSESGPNSDNLNLRRSRRLSTELNIVPEDPIREAIIEPVTPTAKTRRGKRLSVLPSQPSVPEEIESEENTDRPVLNDMIVEENEPTTPNKLETNNESSLHILKDTSRSSPSKKKDSLSPKVILDIMPAENLALDSKNNSLNITDKKSFNNSIKDILNTSTKMRNLSQSNNDKESKNKMNSSVSSNGSVINFILEESSSNNNSHDSIVLNSSSNSKRLSSRDVFLEEKSQTNNKSTDDHSIANKLSESLTEKSTEKEVSFKLNKSTSKENSFIKDKSVTSDNYSDNNVSISKENTLVEDKSVIKEISFSEDKSIAKRSSLSKNDSIISDKSFNRDQTLKRDSISKDDSIAKDKEMSLIQDKSLSKGNSFNLDKSVSKENSFGKNTPIEKDESFNEEKSTSKRNSISKNESMSVDNSFDCTFKRNSLSKEESKSSEKSFDQDTSISKRLSLAKDDSKRSEKSFDQNKSTSKRNSLTKDDSKRSEKSFDQNKSMSKRNSLTKDDSMSNEKSFIQDKSISKGNPFNLDKSLSKENSFSKNKSIRDSSFVQDDSTPKRNSFSKDKSISKGNSLNADNSIAKESSFREDELVTKEESFKKEENENIQQKSKHSIKPLVTSTPVVFSSSNSTLKSDTPLNTSRQNTSSDKKTNSFVKKELKRLQSNSSDDATLSDDVGVSSSEEPDVLPITFIDNCASDAGSDYLSGDSKSDSEIREMEENEIHERGESLHSSSEEGDDEEDTYEKDSFVCSSDEEDDNLLSGSGDDLSSGEELSQSKRSKAKFNERQKKKQKEASREMFTSRHQSTRDSAASSVMNSSGKNKFESYESQNFSEPSEAKAFDSTEESSDEEGANHRTNLYNQELKQLMEIHVSADSSVEQSESSESKKNEHSKAHENKTNDILEPAQSKKGGNLEMDISPVKPITSKNRSKREFLNKSDVVSYNRKSSVRKDALSKSLDLPKNVSERVVDIPENVKESMQRLLNLNNSLSKVYKTLVNDIDMLKSRTFDGLDASVGTNDKDIAGIVEKRKSDASTGERSKKSPRRRSLLAEDEAKEEMTSPRDTERVRKLSGSTEKSRKLSESEVQNSTIGGRSEEESVANTSTGFQIRQTDPPLKREPVISTSEFFVEELKDPVDAVACTESAGSFKVKVVSKRSGSKRKLSSDGSSGFIVQSLEKRLKRAVRTEGGEYESKFVNFKSDMLYNDKIKRETSSDLARKRLKLKAHKNFRSVY